MPMAAGHINVRGRVIEIPAINAGSRRDGARATCHVRCGVETFGMKQRLDVYLHRWAKLP